MARKRISESDLLDFRERAGELSRAVEIKYEELDRMKVAEPEPVRALGLLLLPDTNGGVASLKKFAARMERKGCAVELVDVLGYIARDRFDRTPEWQRRLSQAQTGYQLVKKRADKVAVIGAGNSCALATLIAEQYPADALVTVGGDLGRRWGRTGKSGSPRISRIARNNLFSIVCPVLSVGLEGAQRGRSAFASETRSRDARTLELRAARAEDLWGEREAELAEAVSEFLAEA